ncbi:MAG TPA: HupE/UreJ family protein [Azospirillaceae bacterium]|nr:HupE/UreJ family protein [Azospirillaceae bacterium]
MKVSALRLAGLVAALALVPQAAFAHTFGAEGYGFAHGFAHPVGGWDHLLAMIAVGLWAAQRGGQAFWTLPLAFVTSMILGGALGMSGVELPQVELGIAGSVVALGALITVQARFPLALCLSIVGGFGLFHGGAHGAEMPTAAAPVLYALGFALSTALLHATGVAAVVVARFAREGVAQWVVRGAGFAMSLGGVALVAA